MTTKMEKRFPTILFHPQLRILEVTHTSSTKYQSDPAVHVDGKADVVEWGSDFSSEVHFLLNFAHGEGIFEVSFYTF